MATNTYVALATTTLSTTSSAVILSPIPPGYTDLIMVLNLGNLTNVGLWVNLNGDTTNMYSGTRLWGDGSAVGTDRQTNYGSFIIDVSDGKTTIVNFPNYLNTSINKTILARYSSTTGAPGVNVGLWRKTEAINSITVNSSPAMAIGTTISIYGIANASTLAKATGGSISEDSTYTYHVFGSTGSFTPKQALTAEVLVVAGGGAGGAQGGGGGAGGLLYSSSISLTNGTTYTATVGAGGAAVSGVPGADGTTSSFSGTGLTTISASGGGGGGSGNTGQVVNGRNGGSGGGGGVGGAATGGTGISGQGFAGGGAPGGGGNYPGGGGGGATQAGGTPANNTYDAGKGGNGSSSYDAWGKATTMGESFNGTYYFAGGGGGGIFYNPLTDGVGGYGGYGGGTNGKGQGYIVENSKANTGGGGGGVGHPTLSLAGKGGSGVVIVRYPK